MLFPTIPASIICQVLTRKTAPPKLRRDHNVGYEQVSSARDIMDGQSSHTQLLAKANINFTGSTVLHQDPWGDR